MANIDKVSVKNTVYNIVSPAVVSDYIEVIGGACTKPDGYVEDEVILAKQNDVQLLFKATQAIAFGANIVENTNCVRTTLEEVLKNAGGGGGASSADQVSYDNSDSGLEAENVQEAVDELATNAGTASSQIQTLTNKVANEIATRSKLGAHNFVSMKLSPYKAQANNYVSIGTQTDSQLAFTTENHNYADVQLAYALPIGNYKASIGEITASDSYTPIINIYFLDGSGQNVKPTVSLTSNQTKDFEIDASVAYILISFLGTQGAATAAIRTVTFNNLMIRLATDESADYEPYAMTNQQLTDRLYGVRKDSVDLSTYTSANPYIAPNDGYLYLYCTGSGNAVVAVIQDKNGLAMGFAEAKDGANRYAFDYIKKGMKIYIDSYTGTYTATFRLLE